MSRIICSAIAFAGLLAATSTQAATPAVVTDAQIRAMTAEQFRAFLKVESRRIDVVQTVHGAATESAKGVPCPNIKNSGIPQQEPGLFERLAQLLLGWVM